MIHDLISIIQQVQEKITDSSDMAWTGYDSAEELRLELNNYTVQLQNNNLVSLNKLHAHFLPTGTFQEHSISNGWPDEYIRLAEKFDTLYDRLKER